MKFAQHIDITESHANKGSKMRRKFNPQTSLFGEPCNSEIAKELEQISLVLDANPQLTDIVYADLIRYPTDSTLLADGIRIMTRWLLEGKMLNPQPHYSYSDHSRIVKKRLMTILNTKKEESRKAAYRDLLHYAGKVAG